MTERDGYIVRKGPEFTAAWLASLPVGAAWRKVRGSTLLKFGRGLNEIYGYVSKRLDDLISVEADPRQTFELLEDWERAFGLPDPCLSAPLTVEARRIELVRKMTDEGLSTPAFFEELAARLGYEVTIREHSPFLVGIHEIAGNFEHPAGVDLMTEDDDDLVTELDDEIGTGPFGSLTGYYPEIGDYSIRYYWTVSLSGIPYFWFRVGTGYPNAGAGETGVDPHLTILGAEDLECIFNKLKPAHSIVVFDYTGLPIGDPEAGLP